MNDLIVNSAYFGVVVSLAAYAIGTALRRRLKWSFLNPLVVSVILVIVLLKILGVDYESYNAGARQLSWLLTPATVSLAIPLYAQLKLLRRNLKAILAGIAAGVLASLGCVLVLSLVFGLNHAQYVTLLPKSVTTAIGMPLAQELGGYPSIAAAAIIVTGVMGNMFAEGFLRLIGVKERVAKGIAIGTSSHAVGTSRAMEMGEIEGAMSSLSIVVAGLITVIAASVFAQFI